MPSQVDQIMIQIETLVSPVGLEGIGAILWLLLCWSLFRVYTRLSPRYNRTRIIEKNAKRFVKQKQYAGSAASYLMINAKRKAIRL